MATDTSAIIAWGSGEDGQLGIGNNEEKEWACVVKALASHSVRFVVAGSRNSLAICHDGKLFTWGWNQRGTLGHPLETRTENISRQVKALTNVKIVQAAIGGWHCLAVDDQGRAYAWGGNEYGQCGEEPERKDDTGRPLRRDMVIPQRCAPTLVVRQVAAGGTHSVVLTRDGHVWTWGQPWPPGDIKQISVPVRVQGLESVRLIAVGAFHNLALQEDGTLWAWGSNEYGQLGTGDTQPRSQPVPVHGLSGLSLVSSLLPGTDKWGRRFLFIEGGIQMLIFQVLATIFIRWKFGVSGEVTDLPKWFAVLVVFFICVYVAAFAWSWGPLGWLVPREIFPLEIRLAAQSITVSVNMLFTFLVAQISLPCSVT